MTDDIVQQAIAMDVPWDAALYTPVHNGFTVEAPFTLGHGPQLDVIHNQPRDDQQPINDNLLDGVIDCQESTSFEQLALDLIMNPPLQEQNQHDNNSCYTDLQKQHENDLLRSLLLQYPLPTPPDSCSTNSSPLDDIDSLNSLSPYIDLYDYSIAETDAFEELM